MIKMIKNEAGKYVAIRLFLDLAIGTDVIFLRV